MIPPHQPNGGVSEPKSDSENELTVQPITKTYSIFNKMPRVESFDTQPIECSQDFFKKLPRLESFDTQPIETSQDFFKQKDLDDKDENMLFSDTQTTSTQNLDELAFLCSGQFTNKGDAKDESEEEDKENVPPPSKPTSTVDPEDSSSSFIIQDSDEESKAMLDSDDDDKKKPKVRKRRIVFSGNVHFTQ